LQFAYAAPQRAAAVPPEATKALPSPEWQVSLWALDAIENLAPPPDLMWVNFGKSPKLRYADSVLKHLAHLQQDARKQPFIFISGRAVPPAVAERIFATLPDPANVVTDLVGKPDFSSAVIKFHAQRKAHVRRKSAVKPTASVLRVPNADLRSKRGRLSIKLVAELFGMDMIEIGRLVGRANKAALSKTPDAGSLQQALKPFSDIALLRNDGFGKDAFRKWLNTPNEHMNNRSPLDFIRDGRAADVGGFVFNILTGQLS
ncbi:MAG: DUF2384 domain-containing protein, partial [Opitutaceae bacterium]|nr:DUF2384 domain-containing protein [Opitutaceae bacterium]